MSEWIKDDIKTFADSFAGGTPSRSRSDYYNGIIPWISSGEVNQPYIIDTTEKITQLGFENSSAKWIPKNSILIAMYGATAGQVSKNLISATSNQAVLALVPKKDLIDANFLYYQIKQNKDSILYLAQGSGQPNLSKDLIDNFVIKVPKQLSEQRHIARILSIADSVIENTQAAIAKYKAIKQGMLHDLFTRGIDIKTSKLRPKCEDAPQLYKESKLGMVPRKWEVTNILASTYIKGRIGWQGLRADEFIETGPYLITGTDFINGKINWNSCYHVSETRFQEAPPIQIKNDDVLITKDGTIGKVAYVFNCPQKAILNSGIFVMRCKDESYDSQYFYHLLSSEIFHLWLRTYQGGSTINHLYQREFERFKFPIPSIDEQNSISERLNSLDQQINTEQNYLHKLQDLKQGLMGDLLSGKKKVSEPLIEAD